MSQRGRPPLPHNVFAFDETHLALYFSRLLDLELAETAYRIALTERFGTKRHRAMRTDGRALRRAFRLTTQLQESWLAVLAASRWARVEVEVVMPDVPLLMARGLGSYDAVHAATAIAVGVNALVTLDKGFGLVQLDHRHVDRADPLYRSTPTAATSGVEAAALGSRAGDGGP